MKILDTVKNLFKDKKNETVEFTVRNWNEYSKNIKEWQSLNAKDNWKNAKLKNDKRLYHYSWISKVPVFLVPEPENVYDKYAIAVYIDNYHVGYVPAPFNKEKYKFFKKNNTGVAEVHGGDFKYLDEYDDIIKELSDPIIEVTI